jgi:hypothetical protein
VIFFGAVKPPFGGRPRGPLPLLSRACRGRSGSGNLSMDEPRQVPCEICHRMSEIVYNELIDDSGKRIEWPKVANKLDGIYYTVNCSNCGVREQCLFRYDDTN